MSRRAGVRLRSMCFQLADIKYDHMSMNFDGLSNAVEVFDEIMRDSLPPFFDELAANACYVREHEIVSLFVFGHLVPQFQRRNLDLRQIGIECPVRQIPQGSDGKPRVRKELVVWPRVGATLWNGYQPLAIVEWKNASLVKPAADVVGVVKGYAKDVKWLRINGKLMQVGYACLVTRSESGLTLSCVRAKGDSKSRFIDLPAKLARHIPSQGLQAQAE
jgi:hypothetical protein